MNFIFDRYDEILRATRELDKVRNNPTYQAMMEHHRRMDNDPSYRAKMDHATRLQNDTAHQALLRFTEDWHLYRQVTDPALIKPIDDRALRDLQTLRNNLTHHHAEMWLKSDLFGSNFDLRRFDNLHGRAGNLIPISIEIFEPDEDETATSKSQIASRIVNEFYENRAAAKQDLNEDERLIPFVKFGKKEYRITELAVEEKTNKIAAFLDDENEAAFVYCSPFRVNYGFYKEKIST